MFSLGRVLKQLSITDSSFLDVCMHDSLALAGAADLVGLPVCRGAVPLLYFFRLSES